MKAVTTDHAPGVLKPHNPQNEKEKKEEGRAAAAPLRICFFNVSVHCGWSQVFNLISMFKNFKEGQPTPSAPFRALGALQCNVLVK